MKVLVWVVVLFLFSFSVNGLICRTGDIITNVNGSVSGGNFSNGSSIWVSSIASQDWGNVSVSVSQISDYSSTYNTSSEMLVATLVWNDTSLISSNNVSMKVYVDGQDVLYNQSMVDYVDANADSYNSSAEVAVVKVNNATYSDDSALLNGQSGSYYLDDTDTWNSTSDITAVCFDTEGELTALLDDNYADISVVDTDTYNTSGEVQAVSVGGEVSGTVGSVTLDDDALDDQYYDSEADLTALLDDDYLDVSGDTWSGNQNASVYNISEVSNVVFRNGANKVFVCVNGSGALIFSGGEGQC